MPKCYQSIIVNAPITTVWDSIKNFHEASWPCHSLENFELEEEVEGTDIVARNMLNGVFQETLLESNEDEHKISYSIDDGSSSGSDNELGQYIGQVQLKPITLNDATYVEWSSAWETGSDQAHNFCHQIYIALLTHLYAYYVCLSYKSVS